MDYQSRRQLAIALNRMEAEVIQRSLAGEQPAWMNPVAMQVIMQFRDMSFVAGNKQTLRQLAFGDKEAMTALGLNTAFAALTRVARAKTIATVGALVP